jgi:hypothetical protein
MEQEWAGDEVDDGGICWRQRVLGENGGGGVVHNVVKGFAETLQSEHDNQCSCHHTHLSMKLTISSRNSPSWVAEPQHWSQSSFEPL